MTAAESPTVSGRKYDRGQRMAGGGIAGVVLVALTPRKPPCRWGSGGSCAKNTSFSGKSYPVICPPLTTSSAFETVVVGLE